MNALSGTLRVQLSELAQHRPVFHSEADFQHELAWKLREAGLLRDIRLERPFYDDEQVIHLDLLGQSDFGPVAIELKYWKRGSEYDVNGERFKLKSTGAHDLARYDYWKDVTRVETLIRTGDASLGFVLSVTDDPLFWCPGTRPTNSDMFRIHEGCVAAGSLAWSPNAGKGSVRGREKTIGLGRPYECRWADYSLPKPNHQFRYLLVSVGSE